MKAGTYFIDNSSDTLYVLVEDCIGFNFINLDGHYMVYSVPISLEEVYETMHDLNLEIF